jgi:hypothetical protein
MLLEHHIVKKDNEERFIIFYQYRIKLLVRKKEKEKQSKENIKVKEDDTHINGKIDTILRSSFIISQPFVSINPASSGFKLFNISGNLQSKGTTTF